MICEGGLLVREAGTNVLLTYFPITIVNSRAGKK